jgi:hypothetical protein
MLLLIIAIGGGLGSWIALGNGLPGFGGGGEPKSTSKTVSAIEGGIVTLGRDITLRIPPGTLSADATIAISRVTAKAAALPELQAAVPITSAFTIDIRGAELLKPISLEVVFDPGRIPDDTPLELAFLARFDDVSNRWAPLFGMVDPERHAVVVETDHLSILQGWIPDVKALLRKMSDALVSLSLPTAEIPKCERRSPNYMSLDFNDLLLACIEEARDGILGEAVLRIANNRAFAVLIDIDPRENVELLSPVSRGIIYDSVWSFLTEKVGGGLVYVPPAGKVEFIVRFPGPGDIQLSSEPSRLTLAADVFVIILKWLLRSYGIDPDASDFTRQEMQRLGVTILSMECMFKAVTATSTPREMVSTVVQCFPAMVELPPKIGALAALVLKDLRIAVAVGQLVYEEFASGGRGLVTVSYQPGRVSVPPPASIPAGKIAFWSDRDGGGLYLMDADGRNVVKVAQSYPGQSLLWRSWAAISPDGTYVAHVGECPGLPDSNLFAPLVVQRLDGAARKVIDDEYIRCYTGSYPCGFDWSPDGTKIVFCLWSGELIIAGPDGSGRTQLGKGMFPAWSPRGDVIAFSLINTITEAEPARCGIYTIRPDGTDRRLLTEVLCPSQDSLLLMPPRPAWSPDGSFLVFAAATRVGSPRDPWDLKESDVFLMRADGSGLTNVTNDAAIDQGPVWVDCRTPTAGCEARVTNVQPQKLNVREDPGTKGKVIGQLSEGDAVCVVSWPVYVHGHLWWPVSSRGGIAGWAAARDPAHPDIRWLTPTGQTCSHGL